MFDCYHSFPKILHSHSFKTINNITYPIITQNHSQKPMLITQSLPKIILHRFSIVTKLQEHKGIKFISRGSTSDYQAVKNLNHSLKDNKLFLYSREPIDIALEMLKNNTNIITYITNQRYETVIAEKISKTEEIPLTAPLQQKLLLFLTQNRLKILKTYLDIHPLLAYTKICGFLGLKRSFTKTKIFTKCTFTLDEIPHNTYILPHLKTLLDTYLNTKQLKLKQLDRIRYATPEEIQKSLNLWENTYNVGNVYTTTSEQQIFKKDFALNQNMGEFVQLSSLLEGYGQRSYYSIWQQN